MIKLTESSLKVNTPNGIGYIDDIILTSLGFIQIKVKYETTEDGAEYIEYMKYTISTLSELLKGSTISTVEPIAALEHVDNNHA